ncbi:MAG: magnesium transporter CorA family protein [Armatimonadetes bacterium]|nr:magnesium transporter CorA family protein [Anaerolineae bacterium]
MIRSLVVSHTVNLEEDEDFIVGRNFSRPKLEQAIADKDMIWLDMVDPEPEEITWLDTQLTLHPTVVADLRAEDRRPALLVYPNYLFLSLFQPYVRLNRIEGKEVHCLVGNNIFVTLRKSDAKAVDDAYNRVLQNAAAWKQGVAYFLYLTTQHNIDSYYPLLDRISNQLNDLEENIMLNGGAKHARKTVYTVKQQLINMRQMVAPQREVISNVIGEERLSRNSESRDLFRHLYERLLRIYDVIDAQRDLSTNVLDMIDSQESNKLVEAVNRLTIFSIIFLPVTFLATFFELNIAAPAEQLILPVSGGVLFVITLGLMAGSTAIMIFTLRRKGLL